MFICYVYIRLIITLESCSKSFFVLCHLECTRFIDNSHFWFGPHSWLPSAGKNQNSDHRSHCNVYIYFHWVLLYYAASFVVIVVVAVAIARWTRSLHTILLHVPVAFTFRCHNIIYLGNGFIRITYPRLRLLLLKFMNSESSFLF